MILRRMFLAISLTLGATATGADVLVFAAASLKEPMDKMAARFDDVTVSYGGSGMLARQISLGAPADVVLLANPEWMDHLVAQGDVVAATVRDLASNELVLIGAAGADPVMLDPGEITERLNGGRLALGLTASVPAGIYAKAALLDLGLWAAVADHLAEVDSVRAALVLVARGQAPLGIVYRSDLRVSDAVTEVAAIPDDSHPPIRYLGALTATTDKAAAADFLAFVAGPEGQGMLVDAGFLPPHEAEE